MSRARGSLNAEARTASVIGGRLANRTAFLTESLPLSRALMESRLASRRAALVALESTLAEPMWIPALCAKMIAASKATKF
jgi:hypothetical protein